MNQGIEIDLGIALRPGIHHSRMLCQLICIWNCQTFLGVGTIDTFFTRIARPSEKELHHNLTYRSEVVDITRLVNVLIKHRLVEFDSKPWSGG